MMIYHSYVSLITILNKDINKSTNFYSHIFHSKLYGVYGSLPPDPHPVFVPGHQESLGCDPQTTVQHDRIHLGGMGGPVVGD